MSVGFKTIKGGYSAVFVENHKSLILSNRGGTKKFKVSRLLITLLD